LTPDEAYVVLPMDRNRRAVGRAMRAAVSEMPHVTLHRRADATALLAARTSHAAAVEGDGGPRLTLTVLLARIVAKTLRAFPRVNGRTEEGEIRLYKRVNLGLAVALEDGLTVPVLQDADGKDLRQLAADLADASARARAGSLKMPDLIDGTFTLSNLGAYGVEFFTPLINPPQLAILGVGAVRQELRLDDGVPVSTPMLHLSMGFDHAAMDGAQAARFLQLVVQSVESPDAVLSDHQAVVR
jgi:pyruvate dehydrogenase E2 component (dihydrolipoamide acetyltransferase)